MSNEVLYIANNIILHLTTNGHIYLQKFEDEMHESLISYMLIYLKLTILSDWLYNENSEESYSL